MSLLFDHAVSSFDVAAASLYAPDAAELEPGAGEVPIRPIAAFAASHPQLVDTEISDTVCLPLHTRDRAVLTGQYLGYAEHNLRGEIILYRSPDGERKAMSIDEFAETPLAQRLRFWHADFRPPEYPPDYNLPIHDKEAPRHPTTADELVDGLTTYVRRERSARREQNRARSERATPREIYDNGGEAVPNLEFRGVDDGRYTFRVDLDPDLEDARSGDWSYFVPEEFGIYQENEVLLHSAAGEPVADATVVDIHGLGVVLNIHVESAAETSALPNRRGQRFGLSALLNPVPFRRELAAIDAIADTDQAAVLAGERPVTFTNDAAARSETLDADLNQGQKLATDLALLADDLFCVHGPPGTGKTRTLVEIVRRAVQAGERVLVCADSNQAVDNLLVGDSTPASVDSRSLHAYGQHEADELTIHRANASRSSNAVVRTDYADTPTRADVTVATTNSAARFQSDAFEVLVLDEATQATCASSCIPLVCADRVVLAGDHKQLPPFSSRDDPPASAYGLSLFEHLYAADGVFEGVGTRLQTQYRMHRDILRFPNRTFYDGELRSGRDIDPLPSTEVALEAYSIGGRVERHDHSRANPTEARLVALIVNERLKDLSAADIGVITPYAAQVTEITQVLSERVDEGGRITVDTIDAFQGSERAAIVISLVRSNSDGELGFLGRKPDGPRRLNVALTRAKRYCAVVGDFHTLRYDCPGKDTDLYRRFYEHFESTTRLREVDPAFLPG